MASRGISNPANAVNAALSQSQSQPASSQSQGDHTSIVLEYLVKRGYTQAAQALKHEIDPQSAPKPAQPAPVASTSNAGAGRKNNAGNMPREDPLPWKDGLAGLRSFVYGSLDIHRPELLPVLLPVYVHSYIDLLLLGYREQAESVLSYLVADCSSTHPSVVRMLEGVKTAQQASTESEQVQRWRRERYVVRMTRRGWSLLLGWLQGGGASQSLSGSGDQGTERGREKMLGIINERVRIDLVNPKSAKALEYHAQRLRDGGIALEGGLESELAVDPAATGTGAKKGKGAAGEEGDQPSASTSAGMVRSTSGAAEESDLAPLKLGSMPRDPKLDREVERALGPQLQVEGPSPSTSSTDVQPSDLPPYPPSFRTIDVRREVEKVREARKRIKLGPVAAAAPEKGEEAERARVREIVQGHAGAKWNLPSVCMFTLHDTNDTLTTVKFSDDSSLLACGFSESYIRLWSLRGDSLSSVSSSFSTSSISSSSALSSLRTPGGSSTRKLIGHSGPVYSLSFDPIPGPSGPPRYLLSASQDASVRLWSMDTYSALVAYKGHRDPVWDVEWGPRGVYFATASRDRTARLWTTERVAAVRIFAGHLSDVETVKFHPNSLYLATGSADRTSRLWDVQTGQCVRVFVGHAGSVSTLAISPDGRYLASAGDDATINLWDLGSSRLIKSLIGHSGPVHSLSFSQESSTLVSGGADCTVRVWDVTTSRTEAVSTSMADAKEGKKRTASASGDAEADLVCTLPTKRTPVLATMMTQRNLCLAAGPIF